MDITLLFRVSGGDHPNVLQQVEVHTISNSKCNSMLKNIEALNGRVATKNMFCAGHQVGGKDACQVSICEFL